MANGQLLIKNDNLAAVINRLSEEKAKKPSFDGKTPQEMGEDLVGTYAMDMLYSGLAVGLKPDFTYSTLKELPVAAASCYRRNKEENPGPVAVEGTVKALAAYFFALAMNEHGFPWEVQQTPVLLNAAKAPKEPLWGVFRIKTGGKQKTDFLLPVSAGCQVKDAMGKRLLTIDLGPLKREYKAATGIDLEKHGLRNIAFDL